MAWTSLPRADLDSMIASGLAEYDDDVRAEWDRIRIEPEKWRCSPWGDAGGGFWAVAVDDDRVLWFNDIEEGFNWSWFGETGTIGEYLCNQSDFAEVLEQIAQTQSERERSRLLESDVPEELAGAGTIGPRQTTYWEARSSSGALYRIHFRDKAETSFAVAEYAAVELLSRHPLLTQYDEPSRSVYFSGTPIDPRSLAERLDRVVDATSEGWRRLASYTGGPDDVARRLRSGHGLVMNAPESICAAVASALEDAGVQASVVGAARARPGNRLLLFGHSYVIASAFVFERRSS